ncbi:MAG: sensor histidine kinase [Candidatus Krumholzibacteriia bacterium]
MLRFPRPSLAAEMAMTTHNPLERETDGAVPDRQARQRLLLHELKDRSLWFVRVRWWVPPGVVVGLVLGRLLGVGLPAAPLLVVALLVLGYNLFFTRWHRRFVHEPEMQSEETLRRFTRWQVVCDFGAMFLLVHFTGGGGSPFVFFFIFHVIFASILLRHGTAHWFAFAAALGMGALTLAESQGWLPGHPLVYHDQPVSLTGSTLPALFTWGFFAATVLITSFATTSIMELIRRRIAHLADLTETVLGLNRKLQSLQTIMQSIVQSRRLETVLALVCAELAKVMDVQGCSVKLLAEDGLTLRLASAHGLPPGLEAANGTGAALSPLNRRILAGEPFAAGQVTQAELAQLGEGFAATQLQSVLFVPLRTGGRVIGILGAYCREPERFRRDDVEFMGLAAELVAIALENARAYEAVELSGRERERFMYRIAHNLRAPLAAMSSMLTVVRDGYVGEVSDNQREYLRRVERRADALGQMVNELMMLAANQGERRVFVRERVDLAALVAKVGRTFQERATGRGLQFVIQSAPDAPSPLGDAGLLEQALENLVSNAIKYTPAGGKVTVALSRAAAGGARIDVSDTGIGIPGPARASLFTEFFRADNAKRLEISGTGLGLVIVKDVVERHGGTISFESTEQRGTTFTLVLPAVD